MGWATARTASVLWRSCTIVMMYGGGLACHSGLWQCSGMRPRVDIITLGVTDLDQARRFYVGGLGWEPVFEVPDEIIFIQVGHGLLLGLFTGLEDDLGGVRLGSPGAAPVTLAHNVATDAEVGEILVRAEAAGGRVVKPAQQSAVGFLHGYFADPFGFYWEVACNPGITVADDGRVVFGSA